jgi:hypothetical protein
MTSGVLRWSLGAVEFLLVATVIDRLGNMTFFLNYVVTEVK